MLNREYPTDWRVVPLREITDAFLSGGTPSTSVPDYWDGTIPWITGADAEERVVTTARKYITRRGVQESSTNVVPKGNILLVTRTGVGKVSISGVDVAISQDLTGIILKQDMADVGYLYRQLAYFGPQLQKLAQGTIIQGIQREEVEAHPIPLPSLPEQRRIAEILDAADEAIQQIEQLIAKLKAVKAGLLHDLLTRGLDEQGRLRDPQAHPEQFKESPLGRIPREWELKPIGSLAVHVGSGATPRGGRAVYKSEGILFVRSQNVAFDGLVLDGVAYIDQKTHNQMSRSKIYPHDVLLNITGASIGRCCPFPDEFKEANVNQHVCTIRLPKPDGNDAIYLSAVLASHMGQSQIDRLNAGGSREGINYAQIRSMQVPWPEAEERARMGALINAHDARIRAEEAALEKLRQVKRGLMDDLLTGKVRVQV